MNVSRRGFSRLSMPRSRGAISGVLIIIAGLWGALIPFVGPDLNWAYTPDRAWTFTAARGWLEVFPGLAAVLGGLLLLGSRNRATAMLGGWLTVCAGAWFVVGRTFASNFSIPDIGQPVASTNTKWALLEFSHFSGPGLLIVFVGGAVLARLAVRLARDVVPAPPPAADAAPTEVIAEPRRDPAVATEAGRPEPGRPEPAREVPAQRPARERHFFRHRMRSRAHR